MFLGPLVLLVHLLRPVVTGDSTVVVKISTGQIRGDISTTVNLLEYAAFKGIPYAEPPVEDLRFKTKLTISAITEPLKPGMVWIHDGTFSDGSGSNYDRRPDFLLERDVVFVSINYRLGALGFLSLDHPDATGNQGLKDQNLVPKWVQRNIEKFGGNLKMVAIFGKGFCITSEAVQRGKKLAKLVQGSFLSLSTTNSLLKKLRGAPIRPLLIASLSIDLVAPFVPTLEKSTGSAIVFFTKYVTDKYRDGEISKVPQLLGFVERETIQYSYHTAGFVRLIKKTQELIGSMDGFEEVYPKLLVLKDVTKKLKYRNIDDTVVLRGQRKAATEIVTDMLLKLPIDEMKRLLVEANEKSSVYHYKMTSDAEDLPYIFYTPSKDNDLSSDSSTGLTIDRMFTMWTNFAKYDKRTPGGEDKRLGNITWPKSKSFGPTLEIGDEV